MLLLVVWLYTLVVMVRTRSAKRGHEDAFLVQQDVAVQREQVQHKLVRHSIRTKGVQATLSELDASTDTKPLADTLRVAIEWHSFPCFDRTEEVNILRKAVEEGVARELELDALLAKSIAQCHVLLDAWKQSIAFYRARIDGRRH